ncbi:hypothetical protein DFO47_11270 [Arthrobacter sp. AG258]|nr:hypothetical protein DFO47_11270 [Arthrobacter sp. AG258]
MNVGSEGLIQLGVWEVHPQTLKATGVAWEDVVAGRIPKEINGHLPPKAGKDFPSMGWRVVDTRIEPWSDEVLILGAPSTAELGRWVLTQLARGDDGWYFASPMNCLPVPSREHRRQGLRLQWAQERFTRSRQHPRPLDVVLSNDSDTPWFPTELDTEHVQGVVFNNAGQRLGTGWFAHGQAERLPELHPGQRLTLPVVWENEVFEKLAIGQYQIAAHLVALNLRTGAEAGLTIS